MHRKVSSFHTFITANALILGVQYEVSPYSYCSCTHWCCLLHNTNVP